ncbi:molybdopterin-dependent oxidoreductase [Moritella sp. Urea-trap-13]|uniref:molybdopterin-dependent oxidoreductase n=1 Tax=Moritella sp. Urea-trap-13 TaxID=2058327 RepID=UPI000C333EDA|nr:molybdopterin-dependent oxidoreductase [Moritella sp. Urea-trap-13]PKH07347.1 molybdopterin containing oxidoreductase [Moritella sp. Urea-trap-13]
MKRRDFIKGTFAVGATAMLPINWVFAGNLPKGLSPLEVESIKWTSVTDLPDYYKVLNSTPLNAYVADHMLDPTVTPANVPFVRWNGLLPDFKAMDPKIWEFTVDGESCETPKTYTIADLKSKFKQHTYALTLECGGNSRKNFYPSTKGNQWSDAAVYCSEWTGVLVSDVLKDCGVKDDAVYTGHHSVDRHLSGKGDAVSRGVPIKYALEDNALIAWSMNGEEIPYLHGYPLRIVFGGRPASVSSKAATGISIRNVEHDGTKMGSPAYRVPKYPVAPGEKVALDDFDIIEHMIVKSLITHPQTGSELKLGEKTEVRGHAWAGPLEVVKMEVSYDYGATWHLANLKKQPNQMAWQDWSIELNLPQHGYYEIWSKATDSEGTSQPVVQPQWNPKGYMFNGCHRIAVRVQK